MKGRGKAKGEGKERVIDERKKEDKEFQER